MKSFNCALAYKHKFAKDGKELSIAYHESKSSRYSNYTQLQNYAGSSSPFGGRSSTNPSKDGEMEMAAGDTHPVSKSFRIETNVKTIQQNISSSSIVGLYDTRQLYCFIS